MFWLNSIGILHGDIKPHNFTKLKDKYYTIDYSNSINFFKQAVSMKDIKIPGATYFFASPKTKTLFSNKKDSQLNPFKKQKIKMHEGYQSGMLTGNILG